MIVLVLLITTCHKENYKFIATISTSHQTAYYFVWKHLFYSMQPSNRKYLIRSTAIVTRASKLPTDRITCCSNSLIGLIMK